MDQYPIHGNPDYSLSNEMNPYRTDREGSTRNEPYFTDLAGRSTMVSDNMEMTRRLKAFVPRASVKQGDIPERVAPVSSEEVNEGSNYKSKFQ